MIANDMPPLGSVTRFCSRGNNADNEKVDAFLWEPACIDNDGIRRASRVTDPKRVRSNDFSLIGTLLALLNHRFVREAIPANGSRNVFS